MMRCVNMYEGYGAPVDDGLPLHPTERFFMPVMHHPAEPADDRVAPVRHGYYHGTAYAMWMTNNEMQREWSDGQREGDYVPPFASLSRPAQKRVAGYVASKGMHAVRAAGISDFVERHNVPVNGVEAHI